MNGNTGDRRDPQQRSRRRRAGVLAAALAGTVLLVAACGGRGGSARPAGSSRPAGYQQFHAYSQCMRSHGAPFWPGPSQVPGGVYDYQITYKITPQILRQERGPGWQAALKACKKLAPPGLPLTAAQIRALRTQLLKLATCMRAHGITRFPGPVAGPAGGGFTSPGRGVDPNFPRFLAAQKACRKYQPGP
jgi:hypothetical protein